MRASARMTAAGNGATFFAVMSTCSVMFSEVAETQPCSACSKLLEQMHALGVEVEQLHAHLERRALVYLAQIAHVHLRHHGRVLVLLKIIRPEPKQLVQLVDRAVEQHVVIGDVEMAVIVDPLRLDPHQRRDEGRGDFGVGHQAEIG